MATETEQYALHEAEVADAKFCERTGRMQINLMEWCADSGGTAHVCNLK